MEQGLPSLNKISLFKLIIIKMIPECIKQQNIIKIGNNITFNHYTNIINMQKEHGQFKIYCLNILERLILLIKLMDMEYYK